MPFVIDHYSLVSLPLYWYPVMQSPMSPYPPLLPPPFPQWPNVHVLYTEAMQHSTMNFTGTLSTSQLPPGSE